MNSKEVIYHVNGTAVTWWRHLAASKTFWVIAVFILTAADRWNKGEISGVDFFQMVQIGVIGILIRAAMSRAELAVNAANPDIASVAAREKKLAMRPETSAAVACVLAAGTLLTLTACSNF